METVGWRVGAARKQTPDQTLSHGHCVKGAPGEKWSEAGTGELVPERRQLSWERSRLISRNGDVYWGTLGSTFLLGGEMLGTLSSQSAWAAFKVTSSPSQQT